MIPSGGRVRPDLAGSKPADTAPCDWLLADAGQSFKVLKAGS